ncbi:GntR family transcriptional regulator [Corynebacterium crudilactis]|uniref:GntR family transcriptional regulator n=1 Tax=Corynebacterium crudilactis TaxID=1652495 RepID=A0A172QV10_9CORY|nr:GntR family transcriptional regulator [Corynebacterium crudilactis]ANE04543.1 GntR family transcriptional regulator [Corynebacterium crudilactis]
MITPIKQHHEIIANELRKAIRDREFKTGDPVPSEAELCKRFHTSRGPVRQAIATLRAEGLLSSSRGRRTVVLDNVPTQSFDGVISFSQWCKNSGIEPGQITQHLTRHPADAKLAASLEIEPGAPVVSVYRLRLMDSEPVMVERLNYPLEVGKIVLAFDTDSGSIYQELIDQGVDINNATRTIDAIAASAEDAELLNIPEGSPLLRVRRRAFTVDGTPIESSEDCYLPSKASFTLNTAREQPSPLTMVRSAS